MGHMYFCDSALQVTGQHCFCKQFATTVEPAIRREFPSDVVLVLRHFPLQMHRFACISARAAECAGGEGRFFEMRDRLFAQQDSFGLIPFSRMAAEAGVPDTACFNMCMNDKAPVPAIERNLAAADSAGLDHTPSVIVNGLYLQGADDSTAVANAITTTLNRMRKETDGTE